MGCQTSYSCTITVPTGAAGTDGNDGAAGTNGAAVYANSMGTDYASTGTGLQTLTTYSHTGGIQAAGDILELEAIFSLTTTFRGTINVKFGTATVATYTVASSPGDAAVPGGFLQITLKSKIYMKTASTETYTSQTRIAGSPSTILDSTLTNTTVNTAVAVDIVAQCTPSAGTATLKSLSVINFKKVT